MSEEELYNDIVERLSKGDFLQINGKPINLKELNDYINSQQQEIERLNNIIDELEKWLKKESNFWKEQQEKAIEYGWLEFGGKYNTTIIYDDVINKLQELKGSDKE